jgi:cobalt-precorrin 5A hydrolase / precorrin-3B C17-methyltransferase
MQSAAIVILSQGSFSIAKRIVEVLPDAQIYGLGHRTQDVDIAFEDFGETVRSLYTAGRPIIGLCAAGILIRTIAPLLSNKTQEPPVLAVAEDGSAVVPLLGGLTGVNGLARTIALGLQITAAITTSGDLRFGAALLSPPPGYVLQNPEDAKGFIADLLAGAKVKRLGSATWLSDSKLPWADIDDRETTHEIVILPPNTTLQPGNPKRLVYQTLPNVALNPIAANAGPPPGQLTVLGLGPGPADWLTPEALQALETATDWVGYSTYLDLAAPYHRGQTLHESDNREELDRARHALNLANPGRNVVVISSGDPGIFAMAAAVLEALEQGGNPAWESLNLQIMPGISAIQGAAAKLGAPIGHDFCVISLSDILKPWDQIAKRITAAAQADFVIAFYNPASKTRRQQLVQAKALLLKARSPETLVILARNVGRPGETFIITTLTELDPAKVDMRTLILVGSSQTRQFFQGDRSWIYTPRSYTNSSADGGGV